jgi:hypothetical protein
MKGMRQTICTKHTEPFKRHVARRSGEGKITDVRLWATLTLILGDQLLDVFRAFRIVSFTAERIA